MALIVCNDLHVTEKLRILGIVAVGTSRVMERLATCHERKRCYAEQVKINTKANPGRGLQMKLLAIPARSYRFPDALKGEKDVMDDELIA